MIIVVGMPGAGKSFFASRFSETFGAPVVSYDRIRFELFAQPTFSADEAELIERLAAYQIEELLKSKRSFLIDGSGNAKTERVRFAALAKKAEYETLLVWVQTHERTAETRATKRSSRRDDDKFNTSLSAEQFAAQLRRFTPPTREEHVVISGMHTYNTQAKTVLRKLVARREAEAQAAHKAENQVIQKQRPVVTRRNLIIR